MIHIVWISYCKTATWFTVRFIHLVMETVLDFLFSFQFWFSLCKFASFFFFLLIILVWMHLLLLFDASFFFFLLFVHVCVLLILPWLATLSACPMRPPPLQSQQMHVYLSGLPPNTDPEGNKTPSPSEPEAKKDTKKESKKRKDFKTQANPEPKR